MAMGNSALQNRGCQTTILKLIMFKPDDDLFLERAYGHLMEKGKSQNKAVQRIKSIHIG